MYAIRSYYVFNSMEMDASDYYAKPMNCPFHVITSYSIHYTKLYEPIRAFTTGGVYDTGEHAHRSFIQGGGHGGSHPHLAP